MSCLSFLSPFYEDSSFPFFFLFVQPVVSRLILRISSQLSSFFLLFFALSFHSFSFFFSFVFSFFFFSICSCDLPFSLLPLFFLGGSFPRPTGSTTSLEVQLRVRRQLQELAAPRAPKVNRLHLDGVVHRPLGRLE